MSLIVDGEALVEGVRAGLRETAIDVVWRDVSVVAAQLGDQAELLGAIGLALAEVDADMLLSAAASGGTSAACAGLPGGDAAAQARGALTARAISSATIAAPWEPQAIV